MDLKSNLTQTVECVHQITIKLNFLLPRSPVAFFLHPLVHKPPSVSVFALILQDISCAGPPLPAGRTGHHNLCNASSHVFQFRMLGCKYFANINYNYSVHEYHRQ